LEPLKRKGAPLARVMLGSVTFALRLCNISLWVFVAVQETRGPDHRRPNPPLLFSGQYCREMLSFPNAGLIGDEVRSATWPLENAEERLFCTTRKLSMLTNTMAQSPYRSGTIAANGKVAENAGQMPWKCSVHKTYQLRFSNLVL
jgi:hypothetical protein